MTWRFPLVTCVIHTAKVITRRAVSLRLALKHQAFQFKNSRNSPAEDALERV